MEPSRNPNWIALVRCYRTLCREQGVEPLTETELLAFIEDPEFRPDPWIEQETWIQ